jgi:F0F1-type ATP synthase membrane subunit b/b'
MPNQLVGEIDLLRIFSLFITFATPFMVGWVMLVAKDRRRAIDDKLDNLQKTIDHNNENIQRQLRDLRAEAVEGRKECADDIRGVITQLREYPRRDEMTSIIGDIRQEARDRWRRE